MRETKFRQPIFTNGEFKGWNYWGFIEGGFFGISTGSCSIKEAQEQSQQFIGLLDKNGKEIYEGNIAKRPNGEIGIVEYNAPSFILQRQGNWQDWQFIECPSEYFEDCEVIGGIYENPELLH